MNLWDSVQRGLEKATHEATRLAKIQRLRSSIDALSRQLHTEQGRLVTRTMEIFSAGQLSQPELLPICQELTSLQQQLDQAQFELKQVQQQQAPTQSPLPPGTTSYMTGDEAAPTMYAPPPPEYQSSVEATQVAPPPPGTGPFTVSSMETISMPPSAQRCPRCSSELIPGNAYCHNCGLAVQDSEAAHLPTMRPGTLESYYPAGQETVRGTEPENMETVRGTPPSGDKPSNEKDGG